jgi:hypothetical protein
MEASHDQSDGGFGEVIKKAYSLSLKILSYMISCFKEFWLVLSRGYDSLSREFKRNSLEEELKKQKRAVAEKMLSAGKGDEETRKLLLDKTNALKQAIANQAPSSEKASIEKNRKELIETFFSKSIDTFPTSDDAVLEFQKAKQSLDTFEKSVASASASQIPIKKGKAALGFFMVFLAFCFVAAEKKEQNGANNEINKDTAATEAITNNQNGGHIGNESRKNPEGLNPNYKRGFDISYAAMGNGKRSSILGLPREAQIGFENRFRDELLTLKMDMLEAKRELEKFNNPQREAIYQFNMGMYEGYLIGAQDAGFNL